MSKFHEGYDKGDTSKPGSVEQIAELAAKFPELAAAFRGHSKLDGPGPLVPPMTLMVYFRDGRWRGSLSSTESAQTCYFKVPSILTLFEGLERDILANDFERVMKKGK